VDWLPSFDGQTIVSILIGAVISFGTYLLGMRKMKGAQDERVRDNPALELCWRVGSNHFALSRVIAGLAGDRDQSRHAVDVHLWIVHEIDRSAGADRPLVRDYVLEFEPTAIAAM